MRLEPANAIPRPPVWASVIVAGWLGIVGFTTFALGTSAPIQCGFRLLTAAPCPGCGSTRMVLALFDLRIGEAFFLNPLMFILALLGAVLLVTRVVARRRVVWITGARSRAVIIAVLLVAVLSNWAYLLFGG